MDGSTFVDNLLNELDAIAAAYADVLASSVIINIDPNRGGFRGFIGFPEWGWAPADNALESARMALLRRLRGWEPRFRLLFPHPTPTVSKRLDEHLDRLVGWLVREDGGHGVPPTVDQAAAEVTASVTDLRALTDLLPADEFPVRLVVDTNALIDNPDLASYVNVVGKRYMAHLLPVVLRELDELKRGGRTQDLRDAARRADRRLKGLRSQRRCPGGRPRRWRRVCHLRAHRTEG